MKLKSMYFTKTGVFSVGILQKRQPNQGHRLQVSKNDEFVFKMMNLYYK